MTLPKWNSPVAWMATSMLKPPSFSSVGNQLELKNTNACVPMKAIHSSGVAQRSQPANSSDDGAAAPLPSVAGRADNAARSSGSPAARPLRRCRRSAARSPSRPRATRNRTDSGSRKNAAAPITSGRTPPTTNIDSQPNRPMSGAASRLANTDPTAAIE